MARAFPDRAISLAARPQSGFARQSRRQFFIIKSQEFNLYDTTLASIPSGRLIAGARVAGTAVYDSHGERLGHIDDVMIDKASGRIAYAVLSFGGFLGFNGKHHPLPWNALRYDVDQDGYVVDIDRRGLEAAPAYVAGNTPAWDEQGWRNVDEYYASPPADDVPLTATTR